MLLLLPIKKNRGNLVNKSKLKVITHSPHVAWENVHAQATTDFGFTSCNYNLEQNHCYTRYFPSKFAFQTIKLEKRLCSINIPLLLLQCCTLAIIVPWKMQFYFDNIAYREGGSKNTRSVVSETREISTIKWADPTLSALNCTSNSKP